VGSMAGGHIELRADDDQVLSAGESMALIERQTEEAQRRLGFSPALILGLWGAAYLFGFGAIFLTYPTAVPLRLPGAVAAVIIGVLFPAATVISIVTTDDGSDRSGAEHHISDALMRWLKQAAPGSARRSLFRPLSWPAGSPRRSASRETRA